MVKFKNIASNWVSNAVEGRADGVTQYRDLVKRFNYFLKRYDKHKEELSHYRARCYELEGELQAIRPEVYRAYQKIDRQQKRLDKLAAENMALRKEFAGIKEKLNQQPPGAGPVDLIGADFAGASGPPGGLTGWPGPPPQHRHRLPIREPSHHHQPRPASPVKLSSLVICITKFLWVYC